MTLYLHTPNSDTKLNDVYQRAFANAQELYVLSAYLTEWDQTLILNDACTNFKLIIGKDFGITKKHACRKVLSWLPSNRKSDFLVAEDISGFHPKAIFWKELDGSSYCLIGSSNLTRAAFDKNFEANIESKISNKEFKYAKEWIGTILSHTILVDSDWIESYEEGTYKPTKQKSNIVIKIANIKLPVPPDAKKLIKNRRDTLDKFNEFHNDLLQLFTSCANGRIDSRRFLQKLPSVWSNAIGNRLQGRGWERQGTFADFRTLSQKFISIYEADEFDRDDAVIKAIDELENDKNPARSAFFTEMLCLYYPKSYPVINDPVIQLITDKKLRAPRGASAGVKYIFKAKCLRTFLQMNPKYPAKNLAELDVIIWKLYPPVKKN